MRFRQMEALRSAKPSIAVKASSWCRTLQRLIRWNVPGRHDLPACATFPSAALLGISHCRGWSSDAVYTDCMLWHICSPRSAMLNEVREALITGTKRGQRVRRRRTMAGTQEAMGTAKCNTRIPLRGRRGVAAVALSPWAMF